MDFDNKYGILEAQKQLLDLLKSFHSFCRESGIDYSLAYGSLLGAIRHDGFIPWDDDLDVFVDRKNYDRLIEALEKSDGLMIERDSKSTLWVDRIRRKEEGRNPSSFLPTLDILVLDAIPADAFLRRMKMLLILTLQGMMKTKLRCTRGGVFYRISSAVTYFLGLLFPYKLKAKWYRRVSRIGESKGNGCLANYNGEFSDLCHSYPASMMEGLVEHEFEDTVALVTPDYDICLKTQFGDYMVLPDESDRRPRHGALKDDND